MRHPKRAVVSAGFAALAVVAAGCSSGTTYSGPSTAPASATAQGTATVQTHQGPLGEYLVDGTGRTLYLFEKDTGGTSQCAAACAGVWPPLTTTGPPSAAGDVKGDLLGTLTRQDGSTQVTYRGHPLYRFAKDEDSSDTYGQGVEGFGARWWVVTPSGEAIPAPGSPTPGGGY